MTLVEFLLARISEDEFQAKGAVEQGESYYFAAMGDETRPDHGYEADDGTVVLGARRALAECEAKRRIVQHLRAEMVYVGTGGMPGAGDFVPGQPGATPSDTLVLRLMALPYQDHSDYREEWR